MTTFTVTFFFENTIITTSVEGDHAVLPRAKAKLIAEGQLEPDKALQISIHEHGKAHHEPL